jgi:hypothetical protein
MEGAEQAVSLFFAWAGCCSFLSSGMNISKTRGSMSVGMRVIGGVRRPRSSEHLAPPLARSWWQGGPCHFPLLPLLSQNRSRYE